MSTRSWSSYSSDGRRDARRTGASAQVGFALLLCVGIATGCGGVRGRVWTARQAITVANRWTGLDTLRNVRVGAVRTRLDADHSPVRGLSEKIVGQPLWRVSYAGVAVRSEGTTNRYIDTIDVYVDARTSRFLKLESRWPDGINPSYIEGARHMNAKIREERRIIGPIQVEPPRTRYVVMFEGDHGAESALEKKHIEAYCVDFAWVGFHYGWVMPARHRPARRTPRALRAKETPSPNALATAAGYYAVAWGGMDINTGAPRGPSIYTNGPPMD